MRYGMPYKGSKSQIAEDIVRFLPRRKVLVDLFFGGGAVTDCALRKGLYDGYVINDKDGQLPHMYVKALKGGYRDEKRWISREEFFRLKGSDPYVRTCWSFGNNSKDYLYSRECEPWKKALWYGIVFHDYSLLESIGCRYRTMKGIRSHVSEIQSIYSRYLGKECDSKSLDELQSLENLKRLQSLERLQRLPSIGDIGKLRQRTIDAYGTDYWEVPLPQPSECVLYCDPPYEGTECSYLGGDGKSFDYSTFGKWCTEKSREGYLVYVSSYKLDETIFEKRFCVQKNVLSTAKGAQGKADEFIFAPRGQPIEETQQLIQMSLF